MKTLKSTLTLGLAILFVVPAFAWAKDSTQINGTIQGASYVINHTAQPMSGDDPKVALERDFVLQCDDGSYYFLPNLTRGLKSKLINQEVTISGEVTKNQIVAHRLYKDKAGRNLLVYDWDKDRAMTYMSR
ncbi:MAG: hypothetical protein KAR45_03485 [Desulfobacteraceae bacterium]|nr:hypothetical protein [Desulfobacteraceae bacterium]